MRRNQKVPTSWLVGLGVGAVALLYLRARRKARKSACYWSSYQASKQSLLASGLPDAAAHAQADAVATSTCRAQT